MYHNTFSNDLHIHINGKREYGLKSSHANSQANKIFSMDNLSDYSIIERSFDHG